MKLFKNEVNAMCFLRWITLLSSIALFFVPTRAEARFGETLCGTDGYHCLKIRMSIKEIAEEKDGKSQKIKKRVYIAENLLTLETSEFEKMPTWETLWPNESEREIVQKVNRLNIPLQTGFVIAVPNELQERALADFSPLPKTRESKESPRMGSRPSRLGSI